MNDAPIDHVAIVVKDLDAAIALYTQTLGFSLVYREIVADQGVEACLGYHDGDTIVLDVERSGRPQAALAEDPRDTGAKVRGTDRGRFAREAGGFIGKRPRCGEDLVRARQLEPRAIDIGSHRLPE